MTDSPINNIAYPHLRQAVKELCTRDGFWLHLGVAGVLLTYFPTPDQRQTSVVSWAEIETAVSNPILLRARQMEHQQGGTPT